MREGVEEGIGSGISSLTAVADYAARGGEEDEEVEGLREEGIVEVPAARVFGLYDRGPVGVGRKFESDVLGRSAWEPQNE